ncbi:hypothetical protein BJL95_20120 [Methylomonas sp. LWB]|uniref:NYN domain-containing protein n=1 Tax=Methylomonas sp. LWB TaxID=1905845 RepID=UPI0008D8E67C|nr:NYN domain-containing protein [Methylomonas sp. LWB]OHX37001.1 hypothetical protein BJL95_20120 [Methylomonas sp. LWB]
MHQILKKVVAVDWQNFNRGCQNILQGTALPRWENVIQQVNDDGVDVLEQLIFTAGRVPENDSAEALATVTSQSRNLSAALQRQTAARVFICPAKRTPSGDFKQSDDQRLMIKTLSSCLRLKPDFLTLFASDGDYAPMVWELREWGIRTEVVGRNVAGELREAAYHVVDLEQLLEKIAEEAA